MEDGEAADREWSYGRVKVPLRDAAKTGCCRYTPLRRGQRPALQPDRDRPGQQLRTVQSYLRHVFTHLPSARSLADHETLFPWGLDRAKIMLATRHKEEANYIFEKWLAGGTVVRELGECIGVKIFHGTKVNQKS